MPVTPKTLPEARLGSKRHLFDLVTDSDYRNRKSNASYDIVPAADGGQGRRGTGGRKWGYDADLPAGTEQANQRGQYKDPGRYRFFRWIQPGNATTWWVLKHLPANTYQFHKITIPRCATCRGTAEILCPGCKGTRRVAATPDRLAGRCPVCADKPNPVLPCPDCGDKPVIVDGVSVEKNFARW